MNAPHHLSIQHWLEEWFGKSNSFWDHSQPRKYSKELGKDWGTGDPPASMSETLNLSESLPAKRLPAVPAPAKNNSNSLSKDT